MAEFNSEIALNIISLSLLMFSANLLYLRSNKYQAYLPLALCLSALALLISYPTIRFFAPEQLWIWLVLTLPAALLIGPVFWLYVLGITSTSKWKLDLSSKYHFVLFTAGVLIAFVTFCLPGDIQHSLLMQGDDSSLSQHPPLLRNIVKTLLVMTFVLVLGWVLQSGYYFFKIIRHLRIYRQHLKQVFSSSDNKEVHWINWLLIIVGAVWVTTVIRVISANLFTPIQVGPIAQQVLLVILVWSICSWGLRQKPGLKEIYNSVEIAQHLGQFDREEKKKYQRSALTDEHSTLIANKIEKAMRSEKLYLTPSLSLQQLAKHIHVSPNYISQTLNATLGLSFFDYVNKYRVTEAKRHIRDSNKTVLDIAMEVGFNAKSSFYTAFKNETGMTPRQFKKQCLMETNETPDNKTA